MAEKTTMVAKRPHLGPDGAMLKKGEEFSVTAGQEQDYERTPHLAAPKGRRSAAAVAADDGDGSASTTSTTPPPAPAAPAASTTPAAPRPARTRTARSAKPRRGGKTK
jgi:hypothetical protein